MVMVGKWYFGVMLEMGLKVCGFIRLFGLFVGGVSYFVDWVVFFGGGIMFYVEDGVEVELLNDFFFLKDYIDCFFEYVVFVVE